MRVELNGEDISRICRTVTLSASVDMLTTVSIEVYADDVEIDVPALLELYPRESAE